MDIVTSVIASVFSSIVTLVFGKKQEEYATKNRMKIKAINKIWKLLKRIRRIFWGLSFVADSSFNSRLNTSKEILNELRTVIENEKLHFNEKHKEILDGIQSDVVSQINEFDKLLNYQTSCEKLDFVAWVKSNPVHSIDKVIDKFEKSFKHIVR